MSQSSHKCLLTNNILPLYTILRIYRFLSIEKTKFFFSFFSIKTGSIKSIKSRNCKRSTFCHSSHRPIEKLENRNFKKKRWNTDWSLESTSQPKSHQTERQDWSFPSGIKTKHWKIDKVITLQLLVLPVKGCFQSLAGC